MEDFIPRMRSLGYGLQAKILLAYAHYANGDDSQAIAECAAALELNPRSAEAHLLLAQTYSNLGKYSEALRACLAALKANPEIPLLNPYPVKCDLKK